MDNERRVSLKELSAEYGVSKSTMRRRVLKCFPDTFEKGAPILLTSEQASILAHEMGGPHVNRGEPVHESAAVHGEQIDETLMSWDDVQKMIQDAKREAVQMERLEHLEAEREALMDRVASLEAEVVRLHKALEREQMRGMGFWNRLGQKLIGAGGGHADS